MRRSALVVMAIVGVCLAFGLSAPSAQKLGTARGLTVTAAGGAGAGQIGGIGGIGPGYGWPRPAQLLGFTTQKFPTGVGPLLLSRACNEEHPYSRLCEWGDIFRAIPPAGIDQEVLVAANFDTRPMPMCLNPNGGSRCNPSILMRPAACCGYPAPPPIPIPAFLILSPSTPQTVLACTDTFQFTAQALDTDNQPMEGVPISFVFVPFPGGTASVGGTFSPFSATTDGAGQVSTTLTLNATSCESLCAGADHDCHAQIQAVAPGTVSSNSVDLLDGIQ